MKKSLAGAAVALLLGGSAMAEALSFSYGTNFYKPNNSGFQTTQGTNFLLSWNLDNDIAFGVVTENTALAYQETNAAAFAANGILNGALAVSGIRVSKTVVKMVNIGLGFGAATISGIAGTGAGAATTITRPAVDIVGAVQILSGKGDKISGSLDALVTARYINTPGQTSVGTGGPANDVINNFSGTNLTLAVTVGF